MVEVVDELEEIKRLIEKNNEALEANEKKMLELGSLPAISVEYDEIHSEDLASDLAERDLKHEINRANYIKKLWKDKLFRKHYLKRYANEYLMGKRTVRNGRSDGEALNVHEITDLYNSASQKTADTASRTAGDYIDLLSSEAVDGASEDDSKTTSDMLHTIIDYSITKSDLPERELIDKLRNLISMRMDGEIRDNYLEIANQIGKLTKLDVSIERVVERFKVYNAKLISARDENQRFNLNRIFARIEYDSGDNLD